MLLQLLCAVSSAVHTGVSMPEHIGELGIGAAASFVTVSVAGGDSKPSLSAYTVSIVGPLGKSEESAQNEPVGSTPFTTGSPGPPFTTMRVPFDVPRTATVSLGVVIGTPGSSDGGSSIS